MQKSIFKCPCCGEQFNLLINPDGEITVGDFDISQTEISELATEQGYEFGIFHERRTK